MTDRASSARRTPARLAGLAVLLLAALAPQAASAQRAPADPFAEPVPHRLRQRQPPRPLAVPPPPGPAIVTGYLPRNNNLPMYNEPPRRGPGW